MQDPEDLSMKRWSLTLSALMIVAPSAAAQPPQANERPTANSPRDQVNRGFDRSAPQLGEPLPEVTLYNARGEQVRLSDLRGQHTVLVFGCLT
jgi:cytochrome oxidase Cu insertion factor (SCO1/SenC/PrrC family)